MKATRVFTIISLLMMSLLSAMAETKSGGCGYWPNTNSLIWTLTDDGYLTIEGTGPMDNYDFYGFEWVPSWWQYFDKIITVEIKPGVTSIGTETFKMCNNLVSVTIPNSVTSIGNNAFYGCENLTTLSIPSSVTNIGSFAFWGCSRALVNIHVDSNNEVYHSDGNCLLMGNELLLGCRNSVVPDGVTTISNYAFESCTDLHSITIPSSVTSIGISAFNNCSNVTAIQVDPSNKVYRSEGNCLIKDSTLVLGCKTSVIPNGLKCIGSDAFSNTPTSINIPNSVNSIGSRAFFGCTSLTSISIPESVTSIGRSAFAGCTSLISISFPNGLTTIEDNVCEGCSSLNSITIPNSVTSIGSFAFKECNSLSNITIPNSVELIGSFAFEECRSLTSIIILGTPQLGFGYCGIDRAIGGTFKGCDGIKDIYCSSLISPVRWYEATDWACEEFENYSATLHIPAEAIDAYKSADVWKNFNIVPITVAPPQIVKVRKVVAFKNSQDVDMYYTLDGTTPDANSTKYVKGFLVYGNEKIRVIAIDKMGFCSDVASLDITDVAVDLNFKDTEVPYNGLAQSYQYDQNAGLDSTYLTYKAYDTNTGKEFKAEEVVNTGKYLLVYKYDSPTQWGVDSVYLTINKAPLTVKVENTSRLYGNENPAFKIIYEGLVNGETEEVFSKQPVLTCDANEKSNIGNYAIKVSDAEAENYEITYIDGWLSVTRIVVAATVLDASREYGDENPVFKVAYKGFASWDDESIFTKQSTVKCDATESSNVGQYTLYASGAETQNYVVLYIGGTLNVTPAPLTISVENQNRQYGDENSDFALTYQGFKNGEDQSALKALPTIHCDATVTSTVGAYPITLAGAESENYDITYNNANLEITKANLQVSVKDATRAYAAEDPEYAVEITGFKNDEDVSALVSAPYAYTNADKSSNVGVYPIYTTGGESPNYNFSYGQANLTIEKADQEIIWEQQFEEVYLNDQLEIIAYATSGLDVEFELGDESMGELYRTGTTLYLDCKKLGELVIRAKQTGNDNYYAAKRVIKTILIQQEAGIESTTEDTELVDVYDIHGQAIRRQVPKSSALRGLIQGTYIINGKKYVTR